MHNLVGILLALSLLAGAAAQAAEETALKAEARALVEAFVGRLKPELQAALQAGGPVNAIEVCADQAPKIADALSASSGWLVRRVSLKPRNASRAIPDAWEAAVLEDFKRQRSAGVAGARLNYAELTPSHYRYMQAQLVEGACLLCHGNDLGSDVSAALKTYYPDDSATGYALGDVRGAISLSRAR